MPHAKLRGCWTVYATGLWVVCRTGACASGPTFPLALPGRSSLQTAAHSCTGSPLNSTVLRVSPDTLLMVTCAVDPAATVSGCWWPFLSRAQP
jgi:hypothetical protein